MTNSDFTAKPGDASRSDRAADVALRKSGGRSHGIRCKRHPCRGNHLQYGAMGTDPGRRSLSLRDQLRECASPGYQQISWKRMFSRNAFGPYLALQYPATCSISAFLLISRTSEQEYKLYLYLREVARQDPKSRIPPVYLYDLLHTRSSESYSYGLERTLRLKERLENLTGKPIDNDASAAGDRGIQLRMQSNRGSCLPSPAGAEDFRNGSLGINRIVVFY